MARKILLADDSVTAQNMGRKILADAGYEVIAVNNGSAALKKIAELKPDIIILDVYMPGYSGLEVCQRLKEAQETSRIPVLLTVGKLEPFKPEEAKRVRAEGYIVKPFEASELLSTLSKLEDKIVPRPEPSKPGRFARANAAIDEGRYDKAVQTEEDSGWKNRIGFPSKKKKSTEDDGDDSTIYNAVNKDLRTVVDRKPGQPTSGAIAEESRFDLGAVAPEGLPKDVTPEEIAALAAAAAQVGGAFADAVQEQPPAASADEETAAAKVAEAKTAAASAEEKIEAKEEAQPVAELPKESVAATFAAQKMEEVEAATVKEGGVAVPTATEMMAAIAGLVPEAGKSTDSRSENGSGSQGVPEQHLSADVPVTMAAAAGFGVAASRWTAVAVALAPDEAAISLENEMQKAHAAFAAAEVAHTEFIAPVPAVQTAVESAASAAISSPVEAPATEAVAPAPAIAAPEITPAEATQAEVARTEVAQSISAVAGAAADALSSAVKEFERVAASYEPQPPVVPSTSEEPKSAPVQVAEPVAPFAPEAPQTVEAKAEARIEENPVVEAPASQPEAAKEELAQNAPVPAQVEQKHEEQKQDDVKPDAPRYEEAVPVAEVAAAAVEEKSAISVEQPEIAAPVVANDTPVNETPVNEPAANDTRASETSVSGASAKESSTNRGSGYRSFASEPAAEPTPVTQVSSEIAPSAVPAEAITKDAPRGESEIAETTAAAWASWRRIRESGDSKAAPSQPAKPKEVEAEPTPVPQDEAAMAVAAGAEKSPEDVAAAPQESPDIANMVDSVLAGLRPQIVEEISRKLGKKK